MKISTIFTCLDNCMNINEIKKNAIKKKLLVEYEFYSSIKIYSDDKNKLDNFVKEYEKNEHIGIIYDHNHPLGGKGTRKTFNIKKGLHDKKINVPPYTALQYTKIYNYPRINDQNIRRIGIISLGGGIKESDCTTYWNNICKIPINKTPRLKIITVDNATNDLSTEISSADIENNLDVQMAGGGCSSSNTVITIFISQNSTMGEMDAFIAASKYGSDVISSSWGSDENMNTVASLKSFNALFKHIAIDEGIAITASSGDSGSSGGETGKNIIFPSSSPYVLSVGGTKLYSPSTTYNNKTREIVWNLTGGGVSKFFPMPSYQKGIVPAILSSTKRTIPDVALDADPDTGLLVYIQNNVYIVGGTSLSAPAFASFIACASLGKKFINASLYSIYNKNFHDFHDIIEGSNGAYHAMRKYDCCTGLGSINGIKLMHSLKKISK